MNDSMSLTKVPIYQAPLIYVALFYVLLTSWTLVSVIFLGLKVKAVASSTLLMSAFVIAYTWYFSLGISYRVKIEDDGSIQLTSFRKTIRIHSRKIDGIEAPPFPIRLGFIRFRLEREKAYLFFVLKNKSLQQIFSAIRTANPEIKLRGFEKNF